MLTKASPPIAMQETGKCCQGSPENCRLDDEQDDDEQNRNEEQNPNPARPDRITPL